ncbi:regulatory signaling modulator protein AmpE [Kineobactrum salinum]|uniref:Regulatory signaling modulator protein AmpE n=1 Tax=Kineobactrum salinum TaxID=2708301 RepID=A0A6C0U832_9GAMM|nr:regulatory signaling modulator protein AmpE [Kineobactrum salinum]QIB66635.1 regulatory signaling modulator protein AmpE [Kineobactrum salinum]
MIFLALVIALTLRQLWALDITVQRDGWWRDWRARAGDSGLRSWSQLLLVVGLPLLLALLVLDLLRPLLFGLPWIAAAAVLLLYALGREDLQALVARYSDYCERGNGEAAWLFAREELGLTVPAEEVSDTLDSEWLRQQVEARLCYASYQGWFAVVFYFVVLGPVAAVGYRLLQLYRDGGDAAQGPAARVLFWLDWVPVRLLLATFALAGDFVRSRDVLMSAATDTWAEPADLLWQVASAAESPVQEGTPLQQAAANARALAGLLHRCAVAWIVVIALVAILA